MTVLLRYRTYYPKQRGRTMHAHTGETDGCIWDDHLFRKWEDSQMENECGINAKWLIFLDASASLVMLLSLYLWRTLRWVAKQFVGDQWKGAFTPAHITSHSLRMRFLQRLWILQGHYLQDYNEILAFLEFICYPCNPSSGTSLHAETV